MKKIFLSTLLVFGFVSPIMGQAATTEEVVPVVQNSQIMPRGLFYYIFPSVPPKTFNGMNRIYYEYKSKEKYYIGYYQ